MPTYMIVLISGVIGAIIGFFLASCLAVEKHEEETIHGAMEMKKH